MLSELEVRERAEFCYCVVWQMKHLLRNELLNPLTYRDFLKRSSLGLGNDEFICSALEEGLRSGTENAGVNDLISLYEGFLHAYCEVLESDMETVTAGIPSEFLRKLADEMNANP
jgi:hypothetical protein